MTRNRWINYPAACHPNSVRMFTKQRSFHLNAAGRVKLVYLEHLHVVCSVFLNVIFLSEICSRNWVSRVILRPLYTLISLVRKGSRKQVQQPGMAQSWLPMDNDMSSVSNWISGL